MARKLLELIQGIADHIFLAVKKWFASSAIESNFGCNPKRLIHGKPE